MQRALVVATLTAGLLSFVPTFVTAQKKGTDVTETATDKDYKSLQTVKDMTGKVTGLTLDTVTFRLDTPHMVPNPKYKALAGSANQNQQMQNLYRQQVQAMNTTNPVQRQQRMQQLMASMQRQDAQQTAANSNPNNQPFMVAHQYKDFELNLSDKVIIRKMVLEKDYDDKGNLKTYTSEEKARLKGNDPALPGYKAKVDDLSSGVQVKIYLKMPKKKLAATTKKQDDKTTDKADDKAAADKTADDKAAAKPKLDSADQVVDSTKKTDKSKEEVVKPLITMVVILEALDAPTANDTSAAKKK